MGFFFWRRKKTTPGWWGAVDRKQQVYSRRLADWLARKTSRMSKRRLRLWVIICLGGLALMNIGSTAYSLWRNRQAKAALVWTAPVVHPPPGIARQPRMRRTLHEYLDSLRRDSAGSVLLDSLYRARPGLADTLRQVDGMDK